MTSTSNVAVPPSTNQSEASDLLMTTTVVAKAEKAEEFILEAKGLTKSFGHIQALCGLDLKVKRGSIHGFIGPNGAGKTTTFSILAGFLSPDKGEVRLNGVIPSGPEGRRGILGILPQDAKLPEKDTVGSLLSFYAEIQGMNADAAQANAKFWLHRVGLSDTWSRRCGTLSHGMQKRIGIAQAFLGTPSIVLLDEPTAGLDPVNTGELRHLIQTANSTGQSILVSSHNLSELEAMCDEATIIGNGSLKASGTMEDLTRSLSQVRIQVATDKPSLTTLYESWAVHDLSFDSARRVIRITLSPGISSPETGINEVLKNLIDAGVPISGVSKGDTLESTVISLGNTQATEETDKFHR